MEKEPRKFFNITKMFLPEEKEQVMMLVQNALIRSNIESPNGILDVRIYDDSNPNMRELGNTDEETNWWLTTETQSKQSWNNVEVC